MARNYHRSYTPLTPDPNGLCVDQTAGGAGNLTLNGALVTNGVYDTGDDLGHQISIESTGNLSGVTFTITGTNISGEAISEGVTGPNNSTVESSKFFKTVTQVAVDGAVGTNVELGPVDEAEGPLYVLDYHDCNAYTCSTNISGTINYDVDECFEDVRNVTLDNLNFKATSLNNETSDQDSSFTNPRTGLKLTINSYTAGATIALDIIKDVKVK